MFLLILSKNYQNINLYLVVIYKQFYLLELVLYNYFFLKKIKNNIYKINHIFDIK